AGFNVETKSAAFLRDALKEPLRCGICGGLIHFNSISFDHIRRKEDGGLGTVDNAQLSHPFCNTTLK
ncbi:MAG: HNH endonuclease signature motif containing protein, partial [Thermodesulfovibrionales bacterium]